MRSIRQAPPIATLLAVVALGACGSSTSTSATNLSGATTTSASNTSGATTTAGSPATPATTSGTSTTTTTAVPGTANAEVTTSSSPGPAPAATVAAAAAGAGGAATAAGAGGSATTSAGGAAPSTAAVAAAIPDDTTPTAGGDADAFCRFEVNIRGATTTAKSEKDFFAALKTFEPSMDQWVKDAPTVQLRAAATKVHAAVEQAIASNSADLFNGDSLNDAFLPIAGFCAAAPAGG